VRLPNLQPSAKSISLRLPVSLLEQIKSAAHKRDGPYQSLINMWLAEKAGQGRHSGSRAWRKAPTIFSR
jgi:predicted DNA binding CopG/RHH family protein